jgi:hypothetical protein
MRVTQHGSNSGQAWPMQFSLEAEISRQKSTVSGPRGPALDRAEERDLVQPAEAARLAERAEAHEAEVVSPALHHRHVQVAAERPREQRDVLGEELLLQVLGAGGDDHAAAQLHRRQQVGEGLARSRPRFRQEQAAVA